jgi:hypothetical protein
VTAINGALSQLPLWVILDLFATLGYEPVALAKQRGWSAMVPFVNRTISNCEHILAIIHNNTFAIHCAHLVPNLVGTTIDGAYPKFPTWAMALLVGQLNQSSARESCVAVSQHGNQQFTQSYYDWRLYYAAGAACAVPRR